MKEFIEYIVKHLVDKPEEVQITMIEGEKSVIYELRVGKGDYGKVLGKHGQNAMAIRRLLGAVARKSGKQATLELVE